MTRPQPGYTPYFDPEDALTSTELTFVQELSEDVSGDETKIPIIEGGRKITVSASAPSSPAVNDLWVDIS